MAQSPTCAFLQANRLAPVLKPRGHFTSPPHRRPAMPMRRTIPIEGPHPRYMSHLSRKTNAMSSKAPRMTSSHQIFSAPETAITFLDATHAFKKQAPQPHPKHPEHNADTVLTSSSSRTHFEKIHNYQSTLLTSHNHSTPLRLGMVVATVVVAGLLRVVLMAAVGG